VAFGYFETLFALRDTIRIEAEIQRMKSLTALLEQVGLSDSIYEIFVDATEDVLKQTHAAIHSGAQDESFLVETFNEGYTSEAIITHFRVSYAGIRYCSGVS
jgi:ubiquitin thioesterase protein OTUB1